MRPHQGLQERLRRVLGGWALFKNMGEFYDPRPDRQYTKNGTLGDGVDRVKNAKRLLKGSRR